MKSIMNCMREFDLAMFSGAKVPHGLSFPVIRYQDGRYVLAAFAFYMKPENIKNAKLSRPCKWLVADLITGEIETVYNCQEQDFSSEPIDGLYDMNTYLYNEKPTKEKVNQLYALIDDIRQECCPEEKNIDDSARKYLTNLLNVVPVEYGLFYEQLANILH